jgi:hypothetical protein
LLRGVAFIGGGILLAAASWYALTGAKGWEVIWRPLMLVAVVMLFRGVWEWWRVDKQLALASVTAVVLLTIGRRPFVEAETRMDLAFGAALVVGVSCLLWTGTRILKVTRADRARSRVDDGTSKK